MKIFKIGIVLLALLAVLAFIGRAKLKSFPAMPEALEALRSTDTVSVSTRRLPRTMLNPTCYVFEPRNRKASKGFVFYPGGLVDPRAYAPSARAIASRGYLVVIVGMPFNLAPFGSGRAGSAMELFEGIEKWAIGGHSVGGTFACKYVRDNPGKVDGVIIWASYPSERYRIDDKDIKVICIYGTNNPNCNADEIEQNKPFLPPGAVYVEIDGANHTQFGHYDTSPDPVQPGDASAAISRPEQQSRIVQTTADFLDRL